jgi:hypothetical protein
MPSWLVRVERVAEKTADGLTFLYLGETMSCLVMRDSMRFPQVREESDPCRRNRVPALLAATERKVGSSPTLHVVSFRISSSLLLHTTLMKAAAFSVASVLRAIHITGACAREKHRSRSNFNFDFNW